MDGGYKPTDCRSHDRVAIIITMRDREEQLDRLIKYLHPFLMRQKIDYKIYVITQVGVQCYLILQCN